ncbi:hypothetical protein AC249_AIPGENE12833, partial [Exaiptasia diaphana]
MSGKKSRNTTCPGCKLSKSFHEFGPMKKFCQGPEPELDDEDLAINASANNTDSNTEILKALRVLSDQVGSLKLEQEDIRARLKQNESTHSTSSSIGGGGTSGSFSGNA